MPASRQEVADLPLVPGVPEGGAGPGRPFGGTSPVARALVRHGESIRMRAARRHGRS